MSKDKRSVRPGEVYGMATVLERVDPPTIYTTYKGTWWKCRCQCGNEFVCRGPSLRSGGVKSCGCYRREKARELGLRSRGVPKKLSSVIEGEANA